MKYILKTCPEEFNETWLSLFEMDIKALKDFINSDEFWKTIYLECRRLCVKDLLSIRTHTIPLNVPSDIGRTLYSESLYRLINRMNKPGNLYIFIPCFSWKNRYVKPFYV